MEKIKLVSVDNDKCIMFVPQERVEHLLKKGCWKLADGKVKVSKTEEPKKETSKKTID